MDTQLSASQPSRSLNHAPSRDNGAHWSPTGMRPLSDIREITEPSLVDMVNYAKQQSEHASRQHHRKTSRTNSVKRAGSISRYGSIRVVEPTSKNAHQRARSIDNSSSSYSTSPEASSCYIIPQSSVPRRSSSQVRAPGTIATHSRKPSLRSMAAEAVPGVGTAAPSFRLIVPNHGPSRSPVKDASRRLDPVSSDGARKMPSKTFVRSPAPMDLLEFPVYRHPRVKLELHTSAPLFVGGGSVEGHVKVTIDDNERMRHRRSLGIAAIAIDLVGFEEVAEHRRGIFLALATELLDASHPPPITMIEPNNPPLHGERFWILKPSISALSFMLSLPLDTGPPPFQSKQASIRFLLCITATIRDAGKHYRVRTSHDICVVPTYDPERALTSLQSPLIATDELALHRWGAMETLSLTAGLYRQVWVSGSSIFVDVHISNKTYKPVKKVDLTLERAVLCYKHAPAASMEKAASQARISESSERLIVTKSTQKHDCEGWRGTGAYTSDARTCELQVPRGHATVRCGKYFEVRYFLNVTTSLSNSKIVSVQLPIILIHMNSLDVLPNSVAQVAAAIEEKRLHQRQRNAPPDARRHVRQRSNSSPARMTGVSRRPSYTQGRAFAAPRQHSLNRQRQEQAQMDDLQSTIDHSPRKNPKGTQPPQPRTLYLQNNSSSNSFGALSLEGKNSANGSLFGSIRYHTPPPAKRDAQQLQPDSVQEPEVNGLRDRLRRMHSFDSLYSKKSIAQVKSKHLPPQASSKENSRPTPTVPPSVYCERNDSVRKYHIAPHALGLGLTTSFDGMPVDAFPVGLSQEISYDTGGVSRPATAMTLREKLDRSRFEFKPVRRRASGGIRGKGKMWIDKVRQRDGSGAMDGWI